MYRVAIVCNNGNLFLNEQQFTTIQSAFDFMLQAQRLLDMNMAIQDENGKTILKKGVELSLPPQSVVLINKTSPERRQRR